MQTMDHPLDRVHDMHDTDLYLPRLNRCCVCCNTPVEPRWRVAGSLKDEFESGIRNFCCSRDIVAKNKKMSYRLPGDQQGSLRSFCTTFEGPLNPRNSSKGCFHSVSVWISHLRNYVVCQTIPRTRKGQDVQTDNNRHCDRFVCC